MKFEDNREEITVKDFKEKFCNKCYWYKNNGCDIEIVTLEYCCHVIERWKYKLI